MVWVENCICVLGEGRLGIRVIKSTDWDPFLMRSELVNGSF